MQGSRSQRLVSVQVPAPDRLSFFAAHSTRTQSITLSLSVEAENTAATPASRIFWPSAGEITEPPMMTGMVGAAPPQLFHQLWDQGHVFPGMTADADHIGAFR